MSILGKIVVMAATAPEPPVTRGHKKKARTRRQLVAAAIEVIGERGEAFTISDVADRAGVSNGTFYNYFDDRDALIDAVVPEVLGTFATESAISIEEADPAVRFATITALALARAVAAPEATRVWLRFDAIQQAVTAGEVIAHLRADLRAGVSAGRFTIADEDAALDVIVGAIILASRRLLDQAEAADGAQAPDEAGVGHQVGVVTQLLCSLGVTNDEATVIAEAAVSAARLDPSTPTAPPSPRTS